MSVVFNYKTLCQRPFVNQRQPLGVPLRVGLSAPSPRVETGHALSQLTQPLVRRSVPPKKKSMILTLRHGADHYHYVNGSLRHGASHYHSAKGSLRRGASHSHYANGSLRHGASH